MCGIAGWIARPVAGLDRDRLRGMLRTIAHRGPDDEGMVDHSVAGLGRHVFLGHRRLAILDPDGARQPMCDGDVSLVFNGEIYNFRALRAELAAFGHRFERDSDTEVLLRAYQHWGEDVVDHLRGAFAFALWDARRARLLLARDRFGEKPLYLHEDADGLYFASEAKALLCLPHCRPEVDLGAVRDYLAWRYVPAPRTLFSGIRKLLPGTLAVWQDGRLSERRYWRAPDGDPPPAAPPPADVVGEFLARLDEAVHLQMVSDVPFGAFLSGGLDSSMIVALMTRHTGAVNTFSVGFGDPRYSELPYARQVAHCFHTAHHELSVSHRDVIELLPRLVAFRDAPVAEPSDVAIHRLACAAAGSVRMVLTGEGSDELLGGYPKHVAERYAALYQGLPRVLRDGVIAPLVQALPYRFRRAKTAVANLGLADWRERYVRWFGALSPAERDRFSLLGGAAAPGPAGPPFDAAPEAGSLRRMLYFDQTSWLPDNLLERGDRMSMAASIEARVPFLDHRLAEFVATLPDDCRIRGRRTKWILREAGRRLLPEAILKRRKVGFRVPVNEWFRGELRDFLLDHLQGPRCQTRAYYDPHELDRRIREHLAGSQNHEKLLWTLLNLELWHRQYATP